MKNIVKKIGIGILAIGAMLMLSGCIFLPEYVEVQVDPAIFEEQYYYQQYTEEEKLVYREIYQGILNQDEMFIVHGMDGDATNQIFFTVLYDFPELFWADGEITSTGHEWPEHVEVEVHYSCTKEERAEREKELKSEAEEILAGVSESANDYEKIKYIYETIINQVTYVDEAPENQTIYSSLVLKETVCAGYAKEMQYLLETIGIPCIYAVGDATSDGETESHAWNIVTCNGKNYHVDATWGDPVYEEGEEVTEEIVYDYLCCSDAEIEDTHKPEKQYEYPVCDSEELNYYRVNHMFYENADRQTLLNAMKQTINQKGEITVFKFANAEVYEQASKIIIDELLDSAIEYLGRRYRLNYVECFYTEYKENNKFEVEWKYK